MKNSLAALILLLCLYNLPEVKAEGRDDKKAMQLFNSLTADAGVKQRSFNEENLPSCGTYAISSLKTFIDHHDVSSSVRRIIERATQPGTPEVPETKESRHFIVKYTVNNPESRHNTTPSAVDSILPVLDAYYDKYVKAFGEILNTENGKIVIEIYSFFQLDALLQTANGFTTYGPTPIALNADHIRNASKCDVEDTIAHELFHRVQYAHGMHATGVIEEPFFVEGMAQWGAVFIDPTHGTILDFIANYFNKPAEKAFRQRSYDVAHFWLYLDERFQEYAGKKATGRVIDSILNAYKKGNGKKSAFSILTKSTAALLSVEDDKFRTRPSYKTPPFNRFLQEWHLTNGLKEYSVKNKKLTYNTIVLTDKCGKKRDLHPTSYTDGASIDNDSTYFSSGGTVLPGAANYFNFSIGSKVTNLKIDIDSPDNEVTISIIGIKGNKQKITKEALDDTSSFEIKFKEGTIDYLQIVVSAQADKTAANYTLKINDKGLVGTWFDDTTYYGKVAITRDKDNIIQARQSSTYLMNGSREGDVIVLHLKDSSPGISYAGTYAFRLCPSGKSMIGTYKDDDDIKNSTNGSLARWCRYSPEDNHDDSDCVPDIDTTCASVVRPQAVYP